MTHHNFPWLVAREVWEHRGGFLWTPLIVSAVFLLSLGVAVTWGSLEAGDVITQHAPAQKMTELMSMGYITSALPLLIALPFVMISYGLGALYDERKNKSILFWKSLPISDERAVASKLLAGSVGLPVIYMMVAIIHSIISLLLITLAGSVGGLSLWNVWGQTDTYVQLARILEIAGWMSLSSLPLMCYLLVIGAWSNRPFLMAAIIPVMGALLWLSMSFMFNFDASLVLSWMKHMFLGMVPFMWENMNLWMYTSCAVVGLGLFMLAARVRKNTCS